MNFFLFFLLAFPPIEETIPKGPFTYPGLHPREIIVVDPETPTLQKTLSDLKEELPENSSSEEILRATIRYVRETLFNRQYCNEAQLESLITHYAKDKLEPEIPIDFFLDHQTGVCRHIALITTILLDSLSEENILQGQAFLIRDQTPFGRHAWTLFLTEEEAWHLDAYWGLLENGKSRVGFSKLCNKYGMKTMERQKVRWEND